MVPEFPGLIVLYIIILLLLTLYFGRLIAMLFKDIERKKNITDLLFLKLLLDFIYSNDLMDELEKTVSSIRITGDGNVLEIFNAPGGCCVSHSRFIFYHLQVIQL